jgi:hypothetical protein
MPGTEERTMNRIAAMFAFAGLAALAGCAGNPIVTGTGEGALDAYLQQGKTRGQAQLLAKRTATLVAQRDLIERYAGTFVTSQTEIDAFVAKSDRVLSTSQGLIKGVRVARVELSPDQTLYRVVVQARLDDLEESLGQPGEAREPTMMEFAWPGEIGGGPVASGEELRVPPGLETITATGVGLPPKDESDPDVRALKARRAAKAVALRNLAERVKGVRLSSTTTVRDYVAEREEIRTQIDTVVKGARVVRATPQANGAVEVEVAVEVPKLRAALGLK